ERRVNLAIWTNDPVETKLMTQEEALASGAMALFGEKYGEEVRVVSAGFSTELCGGTHVRRTGDIGLFRIVSEGGVAAGVRRIEAVTHEAAYALFAAEARELADAAALLKSKPAETAQAVCALQAKLKQVEKDLQSMRAKAAVGQLDALIAKAEEVDGVRVLAAEVSDVPDLRDFMDKAKAKLKSGVIVFGQKKGGKVKLVAGVTPDLVGRFHAGQLVRAVAESCGGKGGGKPDLAMAGGSEPEKLEAALNRVPEMIGSA
ncbi:MAG: DHHA1 domain-containing protein, partial [Mariprofundaceae bacterium]